MKKRILKSFLLLAVVGSASTAMATQTISGTVTIGAGNTFSPSAKVVLSVTSVATAYTATSAHLNGTKQYGTVGGANITGTYTDPSKIYVADYATPSTATAAQPLATDSATQLVAGSWTAQ